MIEKKKRETKGVDADIKTHHFDLPSFILSIFLFCLIRLTYNVCADVHSKAVRARLFHGIPR